MEPGDIIMKEAVDAIQKFHGDRFEGQNWFAFVDHGKTEVRRLDKWESA
jgi:hypothetical protein